MNRVRWATVGLILLAMAQAARADVTCVVPAGEIATGEVFSTLPLLGGGVLISADKGLFRFDPVTGKLVPADTVAIGRVFSILALSGDRALIHTEKRWFRFDLATRKLVPADAVETGGVFNFIALSGGGALIRAEKGFFRFDPATGKVAPTDEAETGRVHNFVALSGGGALIHAEKGFFRFDPATGKLILAGAVETGGVYNTVALSGGGMLISAEKGWFRFDSATEKLVPAGAVETGVVFSTLPLPGGGALIGAEKGWFRFDPATGKFVPAGEVATGHMSNIVALSGGGALIAAEKGWFRFDPATEKLVPVGAVETGGVSNTVALSGGGVLIRADKGWFRFDPATGKLVPAGEVETGMLFNTVALPGGGALIGAAKGWFRFDSATEKLVPVGSVETGGVFSTVALSGGGALIGAAKGWFRLDSATEKLVPVGAVETGGVISTLALPGGGALIAAEKGWFVARTDALAKNAKVSADADLGRLAPGPNRMVVRLSFEHPCAPASDKMGLALVATVDGKERAPVPVGFPLDKNPQPTKIVLDAPIVFDQPGKWNLQLRQGATPIGAAQEFSIAPPAPPSLLEKLVGIWPYVVGASVGLYLLAFAVLLGLTRRYAWAFGVITDPVWGRSLNWPFLGLRHVPAVQRWVLEPWFQAVRRTTRANAQYLDPPVSADAELPLAGAELLTLLADRSRLADRPRLWLQGRSGMGKSSVFAAWERSYFAAGDLPSLAAAARRHGFILILLPMRLYAALTPPDANKPQSWVLEAVRLRLEQFGFNLRDLGLIDAMLKAGHIALALDGANEADRDGALAAFARTYPMVRLLVTSQTMGDEGWEVWRLPTDVGALRDGLLALWLGADKGAALARRIMAEGLSDTIVSGYDLRLVADLAGDDPAGAALPGNRIALYRAMLTRAKQADGETLRLGRLKQLAWTMVTQRRREITADDEKSLDADTLQGLAKEGVRIVRQVGRVHEFRHDQMRAFLAALWLVEEMPNLPALEKEMDDSGMFGLNPQDQKELSRFVAPLLHSDADLAALWRFANEKPEERAVLLDALQREADERNVTLVRVARRRKARAETAGG